MKKVQNYVSIRFLGIGLRLSRYPERLFIILFSWVGNQSCNWIFSIDCLDQVTFSIIRPKIFIVGLRGGPFCSNSVRWTKLVKLNCCYFAEPPVSFSWACIYIINMYKKELFVNNIFTVNDRIFFLLNLDGGK